MLKVGSKFRGALVALAMAAMLAKTGHTDEILVKTGEKIAFLGDSITAYGVATPAGYVKLVMSGLEANGVKADFIGAGISGNMSNNMLARVDRDVISKKPQWMTLSCGVNDVWHGERGVPLDAYKTNITAIVDKATAAGIKVVLLTSTMINEDQPNANNQKLVAYNDFLKSLAAEKKLPIADLNAAMQAQIAGTPHTGLLLTVDGVHMNPFGNVMMATGVLKAFGLNDAQLQKANDTWQDIPKAVGLKGNSVSLRQYAQLGAIAAKQNKTVDVLLDEELNKAILELIKKG